MGKSSEPIRREKIKLRHFEILDEFDNNGFWKSPMAVLYGFRRTGKSVKVVSLLWETRDKYGTCYRFSPTADSPQEDGTFVYGTIFPKSCCFQAPSFQLLTKIQDLQNYWLRVKPLGVEDRDKFCLILLDDLSSNRDVINNPKLSEFACNCRNFWISLFICVQYYNQIKPEIRNNCDFFMTNSERSGTTVKKLKTEVFDVFPDLPTFTAALRFYTKQFGGLVWLNAGPNRQGLTQCIFWYRCRHIVGDFTLDCPMMDLLQECCGKTQQEIEAELTLEIEAKFKENDDFGDEGLQNGDVKFVKSKNASESIAPKKKSGKKKVTSIADMEDVLQDLNEEEKAAILLQEQEELAALEHPSHDEFGDDDYDSGSNDRSNKKSSHKKKPLSSSAKNVRPKSLNPSARKQRNYVEEDVDESMSIRNRNRVFEFSRDNEQEELY
jgi:hypothetical protein